MTDAGRIAVSVLLVAYNQERHIARALDGILMQRTAFPFEVLVHDDCSTDGTLDVIRDYERRRPDVIRVFPEDENQFGKVPCGYFTGLLAPLAHGDYLAFCEGDDYWTDNRKLQRQYDYMQAHPQCSECVHAALRHDLMTGDTRKAGFGDEPRDLDAGAIIAEWDMATASRFVRKSALAGYVDTWNFPTPAGDFPLAVFLALQGYTHYDPTVASVYQFRRPGSYSSRTLSDEHHAENARQWIDLLERLDGITGRAYHDSVLSAVSPYAAIVVKHGEPEGSLPAIAQEALERFPPPAPRPRRRVRYLNAVKKLVGLQPPGGKGRK